MTIDDILRIITRPRKIHGMPHHHYALDVFGDRAIVDLTKYDCLDEQLKIYQLKSEYRLCEGRLIFPSWARGDEE